MQTTFRYAQASLNSKVLHEAAPGNYATDLANFEIRTMNSALELVNVLRKIASGVTGGQSPESLARETVEALGLREVTRAP